MVCINYNSSLEKTAKRQESETDRILHPLALTRGKETYLFLYDDENRNKLFKIFSELTSNPRLSFTGNDEGILIEKVYQEIREYLFDPKRHY